MEPADFWESLLEITFAARQLPPECSPLWTVFSRRPSTAQVSKSYTEICAVDIFWCLLWLFSVIKNRQGTGIDDRKPFDIRLWHSLLIFGSGNISRDDFHFIHDRLSFLSEENGTGKTWYFSTENWFTIVVYTWSGENKRRSFISCLISIYADGNDGWIFISTGC